MWGIDHRSEVSCEILKKTMVFTWRIPLTTIQDKVSKTMKTEICETYSGIKRTFVIVVPDHVDEVFWLQYTLA